MAASWFVPLIAGLLSLAFAGMVGAQFVARRRPHQLAWTLGLAAFATASLLDAWVVANGWNVPVYWTYLVLASGNVGLLGLGTMYLLRQKRLANGFAAYVVISIAILVLAPALVAEPDLSTAGAEVGLAAVPRAGFGIVAVLSFIFLSSIGGTALIGGALWSWWQTRNAGVLLIGLGALLVAMGGTVAGFIKLGTAADVRLLTQLAGISVMFAGFLRSRETTPPQPATTPA